LYLFGTSLRGYKYHHQSTSQHKHKQATMKSMRFSVAILLMLSLDALIAGRLAAAVPDDGVDTIRLPSHGNSDSSRIRLDKVFLALIELVILKAAEG
jgi:hypothetical protein